MVWERDPNLPPGVGVSQPASVREFLKNKGSNDPQAAWLLLMMCALTLASFGLRVVRAELTEALVRHHVNVWNCAPPLETHNASGQWGAASMKWQMHVWRCPLAQSCRNLLQSSTAQSPQGGLSSRQKKNLPQRSVTMVDTEWTPTLFASFC